MMNAKKEFLNEIIYVDDKLVCAKIKYYNEDSFKEFVLKPNFSDDEYDKFLEELDFEYDDGYGSQELFGIILFEKGWCSRIEYDGSEWWEYNLKPSVEDVLNWRIK